MLVQLRIKLQVKSMQFESRILNVQQDRGSYEEHLYKDRSRHKHLLGIEISLYIHNLYSLIKASLAIEPLQILKEIGNQWKMPKEYVNHVK